ncbi:MAG: SMP-30/gluconolactonase/LRE family protein [Chloroflexota bacterium]
MSPSAPASTGVYEPNQLLQGTERFGDGNCLGPEDIAIDSKGELYSGMRDGRIMRLKIDSGSAQLFVDTGGSPSGMAFDANGNLIVADSEIGLLSIAPNAVITLLTNEAGGQPIKLANDLDIAENGIIYFSDFRYYSNSILDFMDGRPLARLLSYDPLTQTTQVLMDGLYAANGVTLGPDDAYVLVNEMTAYRVTRYWLTGDKKGQTDIFIENLPGSPDNITFNGEDTYWLALYAPRSAALEFLQARPVIRGILKPLPLALIMVAENDLRNFGYVLGLNLDGEVIYNLQDPSGKFTSHVTSAYEYEEMLYLGNISDKAIYRISVP